MKHNPGIGATAELRLRVSIATLVRVLFNNPGNDELMLALERKATLRETESGRVVEVKSQPFGGAIRILDLNAVRDVIGDFHFDSEHSRAEGDFRIFIRPSNWSALCEFCLHHLSREYDPVLETDPIRELTEEFAEALKVDLMPEKYVCKLIATIIENEPSPTGNFHSKGAATARVYRVFEASITDSSLAQALLKNREGISDEKLFEHALIDFENGGNGWANAILAIPLKRISEFYQGLSPNERDVPIVFEKNLLDVTVSAILEGIAVTKYQRL